MCTYKAWPDAGRPLTKQARFLPRTNGFSGRNCCQALLKTIAGGTEGVHTLYRMCVCQCSYRVRSLRLSPPPISTLRASYEQQRRHEDTLYVGLYVSRTTWFMSNNNYLAGGEELVKVFSDFFSYRCRTSRAFRKVKNRTISTSQYGSSLTTLTLGTGKKSSK